MDNHVHNILYVDDEDTNLTVFKAAFRKHYKIFTATSARDGFNVLKDNSIDLIITDQRMPQMTGVQFLEAIIPDYPDAIRMILTGFTDIDAIIKAINTGRVYRYIAKPWDENEMKITIDRALEMYELQRRNRDLVRQLHEKVQEQERVLKLFQRYVPEHVVREVIDAKTEDAIFEGESRIVSVLFSDIRNFTRLSAQMQPSDVVRLLNDYFTVMTESVRNHKGSVNKFLGDGLLATFGAPLSYIDNQENAVLCALDMVTKLETINSLYRDKLQTQLEIGIGINTGEVVAGNIGSRDKVEYTVIGDTVNMASRIESITKSYSNCILISEGTYSAVKDLVNVKEWKPKKVKGKEDKIKVYQVMSRKKGA